jgi:3-oxoacyl-[acyl-carrier protein] reductase
VAEECEAAGVETLVVKADVSSDAECRRLAAAAMERWGRIDGLVNNAGTTKFCAHHDLDGLSAEDFQAIYAVNVVGPYQMVRAVAPHMREAGHGSVVNVASVAGVMGSGSSIAYAASKGALNTMTLSLARVLGPAIRVNTVCPGFVQGNWLREGMGAERYEATLAALEASNPLRRAGTPEDMAEAVLWFLEGAGLVTGEIMIVDAGAHLAGAPLKAR